MARAAVPHDGRLRDVQLALWAGASVEELHEATGIDPWFLDQVELINEVAAEVHDAKELDRDLLARAKRHGFSDVQVGRLRGMPEDVVRGVRHALGIRPVFKTVDTCAAEFAALTPYHYSSYDEETEVAPRGRAGRADPRQRAQPDRAGHRVRLLLRARVVRAARAGPADRDGQLQPRDGQHRLRHLGPALLRAAHARGRPRGLPRRAAGRAGRGRHRAARRADPARPRAAAQGRGRADRRHQPRGDPPGRGPAAVLRGPRRRRPGGPEARHRDVLRGRAPGRRHASATRSSSGPRTSSAAVAWRSSTTRRSWPPTWPRRPRCRPTGRCWSTASSTTPSRSTWTRSSTARSSTSAA